MATTVTVRGALDRLVLNQALLSYQDSLDGQVEAYARLADDGANVAACRDQVAAELASAAWLRNEANGQPQTNIE